MIAVRSFHLAYGESQPGVLRDLSFTIPSGTIAALLGPTGAGKTTLLNALSGAFGMFHHASRCAGSVEIGGRSFAPIPDRVLFPDVGMLLQEPHLQFSGMAETVEAELQWTLANLGIAERDAYERITSVLAQFNCSGLRSRTLRSLSGGELHRIAFASVLVVRPSVLLLDEPFSSLDQNARALVARLLDSLRGTTTILFTDTEPDLALRLASRIIVIEAGAIPFDGTRKDFLDIASQFSHILPLGAWPRVRERLASVDNTRTTARRLRKAIGLS